MSIERIHKLVFEAIETARENGFGRSPRGIRKGVRSKKHGRKM